jgi:hypothetical protein
MLPSLNCSAICHVTACGIAPVWTVHSYYFHRKFPMSTPDISSRPLVSLQERFSHFCPYSVCKQSASHQHRHPLVYQYASQSVFCSQGNRFSCIAIDNSSPLSASLPCTDCGRHRDSLLCSASSAALVSCLGCLKPCWVLGPGNLGLVGPPGMHSCLHQHPLCRAC